MEYRIAIEFILHKIGAEWWYYMHYIVHTQYFCAFDYYRKLNGSKSINKKIPGCSVLIISISANTRCDVSTVL